jgi:hypothetical protein
MRSPVVGNEVQRPCIGKANIPGVSDEFCSIIVCYMFVDKWQRAQKNACIWRALSIESGGALDRREVPEIETKGQARVPIRNVDLRYSRKRLSYINEEW